MPPRETKELAPGEIPEFKPDLSALKKAVQLIDRVRVVPTAPTDTHPKVTVTKPELVARFKLLLDETGITPSFTPAARFYGPPAIEAYREDVALFTLVWQEPTKFELISVQDSAVFGSYVVPEGWYQRYLELCKEARRQEPNSARSDSP